MTYNQSRSIKWCDIAIESGLVIFILVTPIREHTATIKSLGIGIPLLAWVVKILTNKRVDWVKTPLDYPFALFIFISILSTFFSINIMDSIWAFKHFLFKFILIYFILANNIKDDRQIKRLIGAIVAINLIHSSAAVFNYLSGARISGIIGTFALSLLHNSLGKFLVITTPIIGIFYSLSKSRLTSLLFIILFLLSTSALILTFSRGSWIAFIGSIALWSAFKDRKSIIIFVIIFLLAAIFVFPVSITSRVTEGLKKGALKNRPAYWKAAMKMIKERPILGFGYGSGIYAKIYPKYRPKDAFDELPSHVHNMYLATAVESGILGFLAFMQIFYVYIKETIKSILKSKNEPKRTILIGILASLTGLAINGLIEITLVNHEGMYFWILAGIAMGIVSRENDKFQLSHTH